MHSESPFVKCDAITDILIAKSLKQIMAYKDLCVACYWSVSTLPSTILAETLMGIY